MRKKCTTIVEVNKTKIAFTNKPMTAYGGFSLLLPMRMRDGKNKGGML
jgi:hypothetical protein